tara:strand:- start:1334 stop:1663 length:330 start_codon:yes stop_codon:yes gene_type:complete
MSGFTSYNVFSTLSTGSRLSASESEEIGNLNVYPNPTKGVFNISFTSEEIDNFEITIIDAFGKVISKEEKQDFIGEFTKQVDLTSYIRGVYMIQIRTSSSLVNKRVVLQ